MPENLIPQILESEMLLGYEVDAAIADAANIASNAKVDSASALGDTATKELFSTQLMGQEAEDEVKTDEIKNANQPSSPPPTFSKQGNVQVADDGGTGPGVEQ